MLNLNDQILDDLKQAMIARRKLELSVLRMLITALKNRKISLGSGGKDDLSEEQIIEVIAGEVKKRKDSIVFYEEGGRKELVDKEREEIKILEKHMPEQISEEELKKEIKEIISSLGEVNAKDFGRVMGAVMPKFKGKADGNAVTAIVKEILG